MKPVELIPVLGIPEIHAGDDLSAILARQLDAQTGVQDGDVLVIAQKVVSKSEGLLIDLAEVQPSAEAVTLAKDLAKDPRKVEVVLRESNRIVKSFKHSKNDEGTLICEHLSGHISANAGVDQSNIDGNDTVLILPRDPDASAARIHREFQARYGCRLGIVISDTFGRPWRLGQVNVAIGVAGMPALRDDTGSHDAHGRELAVTMPALADELAAASGLVISKASQTPLVLIRGLDWPQEDGKAGDLIRAKTEDVFR